MTTHFFRCSSCQCSLLVTERPGPPGQPTTFLVAPCWRCHQRAARDAARAAVETVAAGGGR